MEKIKEEYASIGISSGVEEDSYAEWEYPFNAEEISISLVPVPLNRLVERIKNSSVFAPEIQRGANLWNKQQKSRLIESLMLRIPLPLFYVAADADENWKIVDGLQRISAIKHFMIGDDENNKMKLAQLEFFSEKFNNKIFDDLPAKYQNRIKDAQFQFAVISSTTPPEVQRNIFKRLNTGGLPLTSQEIRHALYYEKKSADFLLELAHSGQFNKAVNNSVNDSRMAAQELILRFIAFLIRAQAYTKSDDMDSFLSDTIQLLNVMPDFSQQQIKKYFFNRKNINIQCKYKNYDDIRNRFFTAMDRAKELFGEYAFRKSMSGKKTPINKSLFETISVILAEMNTEQFNNICRHKEEIHKKIENQFETSNLRDLISKDSQKISSVKERFEIFNKLLS
ncbi:MAG: DUF262 domain-containing protein [Elusimicrobiota bacterium]|jgi:hypothetical protein|nr:DUF262 domain-containing protein [Elusimicrobiota bacterium]